MKIRKSFEQAVCVLIMIALQKGQRPVKSSVISQKLGVSDSYLKKVMGKMRQKGLVLSDASKDGGFSLARPLEKISMLDVYLIIEGEDQLLSSSHLANKIFDETFVNELKKDKQLEVEAILNERVKEAEHNVLSAVLEAEQAFLTKLSEFPLSNITQIIQSEQGIVDWERLADLKK